MLFSAYAVLFGVSLYLNRADARMLLLTLVVTASLFLPVPHESPELFYGYCMLAELTVALIALVLRARGSELVISICVVLEVAHVMGYILDGYPPLSSYRILVPLLELAQLLACVSMSPVLYPRLRNRL